LGPAAIVLIPVEIKKLEEKGELVTERRELGERKNGVRYCCESMKERVSYDA
jgi:hypothetical protein